MAATDATEIQYIVTDDGVDHIRVDVSDIDFSGAQQAAKLSDVFLRLSEANERVVTEINGKVESDVTLEAGRVIVYNLGNAKTEEIEGYETMSKDEQVIAKMAVVEPYVPPASEGDIHYTKIRKVGNGYLAKPASAPRTTATIPFDFVLENSDGTDMFMPAGSAIVLRREDYFYGLEKTAMENTYGEPGADEPFIITHKAQIMAGIPVVTPAVFKPEVAQRNRELQDQIAQKKIAVTD